MALRCCLQVQVVTLPARIADSSFLHGMKQSSGSGTFLEKLPGALKAKGGISMSLMEILTLLTVILMLLSLILDAVRLTVEVMEKFSQCKNDGNKKD